VSSLSRGTPGAEGAARLLRRSRRAQSAAPAITAILPVKNRAHHLPALLERIAAQDADLELEIVAIDSGSTDQTVEVLADFDCSVLQVDEQTFDYALTRNAAVEFARGEFLLFISSTMLPLDRRWLQPLIDRMRGSANLAGVYSRGIPSPRSSVMNARDYLRADLLTNRRHFPEVTRSPDPLLRVIADRAAYDRMAPADLRQFISFSNVSSLVRADVFRRHPFSRVSSVGEDMLWARSVLEAAHEIRYEPLSTVVYSHDYSDEDLFRRSFDDALGNREIAGVDFSAADVFATIRSIVFDDWRYLRFGMASGGELENDLIRAALRRTLQVAGQWLGATWRPEEDLLEDLLSRLTVLADEGLRGGDLLRILVEDAAAVPRRIEGDALIEVVLADWSGLPAAGDDELLDALLRHASEFAGAWLAANRDLLNSGVRGQFSLIASIRNGYRTGDMTPATIGGESDTRPSGSGPGPWLADLDALRAVIAAHEREYLVSFQELRDRARAMADQNRAISDLQKLMLDSVSQRDTQIRGLQAELHAKVAERDAMIRDLQQEMHTKVLDCNRVIQELQRRIATSPAGAEDLTTNDDSSPEPQR
jgi:rhamnosyltransferase